MDERPATRRIDEIIVGKRHRRDLGDIADFANRLEARGLLQPIVIRPDGRLVAGQRRLEAFRLLGRTEVPVTVKDGDDDEIVLDELAENVDRKGFTAVRDRRHPPKNRGGRKGQSEGATGEADGLGGKFPRSSRRW